MLQAAGKTFASCHWHASLFLYWTLSNKCKDFFFSHCSLKLVFVPWSYFQYFADTDSIFPPLHPLYTPPHSLFRRRCDFKQHHFHLDYFFISTTFHRSCVCQTSSYIFFSYFKANTVSKSVFDRWTLKKSWISYSLSNIRQRF